MKKKKKKSPLEEIDDELKNLKGDRIDELNNKDTLTISEGKK